MSEENKQKRIEEIEEKIAEELSDVERLEKEERRLLQEEREHDHDHGHEHHHPREVNIIIDRKHLKSPRETTGAALYLLGEVAAGFMLYRETRGPREDEPIPNDAHRIELYEGEKFYSSPGKVTPGASHE